jgi:hypothetical protein
MCIAFEYGESASNETKCHHNESAKWMTTPKYLKYLWDAELRNTLREAEIGTSQRTLSTGGYVTAILASGDARCEPGVIDRAWMRLWRGSRAVDENGFGFGFEFRFRIRFDVRFLFRFRLRVIKLRQTIS